MSEGFRYTEAMRLPLAVLWSESGIARERVNEQYATTASLTQACIADFWGGSNLRTALERLV